MLCIARKLSNRDEDITKRVQTEGIEDEEGLADEDAWGASVKSVRETPESDFKPSARDDDRTTFRRGMSCGKSNLELKLEGAGGGVTALRE
jgi:hypothetical protein